MTFITMSHKELNRYDIIKKLLCKEMNGTQAAELLRISTRQVRRLKGEARKSGAAGLIHGNRGKPGNRQIPPAERSKIITLLHQRYVDFKPGFVAEKLDRQHGIVRDPTTIRHMMIGEGLWIPKHGKAGSTHRSWRQRKAHFGEMEQFDGSYHPWFEERAPACCLLAAIDDARGIITKLTFAHDEGVIPVFTFWKGYLEHHGKPYSVYLDKFSTYHQNHKNTRENEDIKTQFQRAMEELQIEPITAHSPQAKGRVERLFGTLQDRLVKELRLAGISTTAEANQFLEKTFIPAFNAQFAVEPAVPGDLHRPLTKAERQQLDAIFSRQSERIVQNDFTISYKTQWCQLTKRQPATVCKKDKVIVEERLDGSIWIRLRGMYLAYEVLPERPHKAGQVHASWVLAATADQREGVTYRPPINHPWRRSFNAEVKKRYQLSEAAENIA